MSIAKRSMNWLVLTIIVFALVLTSVFTLSAGLKASATGYNDLVVIASGEILGEDFPNLVQSGSAKTLTVKYYFSAPSEIENPSTTALWIEAYCLPQITYVDGDTEKVLIPTSVSGRDGLTEAEMVTINAGTANEKTQVIVTSVDRTTGKTADVIGVTENAGNYSITAANYMFEAVFTIPANADLGCYVLGFADDEALALQIAYDNEDVHSFALRVNTNANSDDVTKGFFNVRAAQSVPEIQGSLVYNGTEQTGVAAVDGVYSVAGTASATNAGNYVATLGLNTEKYFWAEEFNGTINWSIAALPVIVAFDSEQYVSTFGHAPATIAYTFTYGNNNAAVASPMAAIQGVGYVVYDSNNQVEVDDEITSATAAGSYTLRLTGPTANTNYIFTASDTAVYTVNRAAATVEIVAPAEDNLSVKTFNGTAVTIGTTGTDVIYEITGDQSAAVTVIWDGDANNAAPSAAGTHTVKVMIAQTANYSAAESDVRSFVISKAAQTVTIGTNDRIYNASNIAIGTDVTFTSNSANYANASLVTTGSTVGSTTPYAAGNATTHYFKVFVPGDSNYSDYISETQTLAIAPLAVVVTPVNVNNVNYTGSAITSFTGGITLAASEDEAQAAAYARYLTNKGVEGFADKVTYSLTNKSGVEVVGANTYSNAVVATGFGFVNDFDAVANFTFTSTAAQVVVDKVANSLTITYVNAQHNIVELESGASLRDYTGVAVTAARSGADIILTTIESDGALIVKWYSDNNNERGSEIAAPVMYGTYWIGVAVGEGDNHTALAETYRRFVINEVEILISFQYQYGSTTYPLYYANGVLRDRTSNDPEGGQAFTAGDPLPAAPTFRFFSTNGLVFNNAIVTTATLPMNGNTLTAIYNYNVGLGDVNGDARVNIDDIYSMRNFAAFSSLQTGDKWLNGADAAWTKRSAQGDFYFSESLDVNDNGKFNAADVIAMRQALATGYGYYIITGDQIAGQKIKATTYQEVETYAALVEKVTAGYPVKLLTNITASEANFNVALLGSAMINLNNYTLTVKTFSLTSSGTNATLRIENGTIVAVGDITVSAPYGNVNISNVNNYNYEGANVIIQAYNSSLHIEQNVGFYQYVIENKTLTEVQEEIASADIQTAVAESVADVKETVQENVAKLANEETKAAAVTALKAIAASVKIPVDTHVVVENNANLITQAVEVTQAVREVAQQEEQTTTFSIEVKNSDAVVVGVDAQNSAVEFVDIAGQETKVEVTGATVSNTVKTFAELATAVQKDDAKITLGANIEMTSGLTIQKNVVIDMNGKTLSIGNPNMTLMFYVFGKLEFTGTGLIKGNFTNSNELCAIWLTGSADNTVEAGSVSLVIGEGVTLMTNKCGVGVWPASSEYAYGVAIDVKGTIQSSSYAITPNGNLKKHEGDVVNNEVSANVPTITVYGTASLISSRDDASAIYAAGFFKTVVKSGATLEGASAIYVKSGFMTIESGVTLNATRATKATYVFNGNGGDATGDAIVIDNCFYPGENSVVNLGENLTFNVAASDATTVATYWAVGTPEQFATAIANNASYIFLKANIAVTSQIVVDNDMIIDLNGKTISYAGTDALASGVIGVKRGATLTINDNTASQAGMIDGSTNKTYAAVAVTVSGEANTGDLAKVIVNAGTLKGYYYGVVGNGSRHNTEIVVNGGTLYGINGSGLYNPQDGSVTINGGLIKGGETALEIRAGELEINDGVFECTATTYSVTGNGSGTTVVGAIIAISQHTTLKEIDVTINGGTFENGIRAILIIDTVNASAHSNLINVTINGGSFDSVANAQTTTIAVTNGNLTINGGTFNCAEDNVGDGCSTVYVNKYGYVTINGGTFSSDATYAGRYWTLNVRNADLATIRLNVQGGSYTEFDPSNPNTDDSITYVVEGYTVVEENGIYTVVAAE